MSWNNRPGPDGFRGNQHCRGSGSFSKEDDAFILKNYRSGKDGWTGHGLTTKQIATHLGRKRNTVVSRYHILKGRKRKGGVYSRNYTPADDLRYQSVDTVRPRHMTATPSLHRTKFEDLDPRKYDE